METIQIFDTTLRDGQQCPGAGMSFEKNIAYARTAAQLGVDVLEAGFPAASKLDFAIVQAIAADLAPNAGSPVIAALCQLRDEQIDLTIEALSPAVRYGKARLHTYLPVDPALMQASLGARASNRAKLVDEVYEFVRRAAAAGLEAQFSPEGYSQMGENFDFVSDLIRAAISAGARVINCPDTIGSASKLQGEEYFVYKMSQHREIVSREFPDAKVIWSVHCHNDLGLAVENTLNAVFHGPARQIEGCFNGIGERAGNAALEQCVMVIKRFGAQASSPLRCRTGIKTEHLQSISNFVADHMLPRQPHWPICGDNAARHSSGGHTNAILKNPLVYQAFDPRETGSQISLLFGPLSGSNHAQSIIEGRGYRCDDHERNAITQYIKDFYSTRRKGITENELMQAYVDYRKPIAIDTYEYSKSGNQAQLRITGRFFGEKGEFREVSEGRDSALATLKKAIDRRFPGLAIETYSSHSSSAGIEATSISTILLIDSAGRRFRGSGEDQDIEISAMKALVDATNQAFVDHAYSQAVRMESHVAA